MHRYVAWLLLCFCIGLVSYPAANYLLWEYRHRFIPTYHDCRILCERSASTAVDDSLVASEDGLALIQPLMTYDECARFFDSVARFRNTLQERSLYISLVVFLATVIVRFVMFPVGARRSPTHRREPS